MNEQSRQAARAIIEEANAYKGLITVLTRRLEQFDDPVAKIAAAEFLKDPNRRLLIEEATGTTLSMILEGKER